MRNTKPPFEITNSILDEIAEIAELVGRVSAAAGLPVNPTLRRTNRIRSVYSSLAIEQNTLSLEQVTAVLNGKRVIAPPKNIAEVKNAYEIYERMDSLDPYSAEDLLSAHAVMTRGLVEESGCFRSKPVGVVDKQGNVLHFGTLPDDVPGLVKELLEWTRDSDFHMCKMVACTLQMLAFRSISQNAPIVQSQWKKALHTASCEVSELELFRILAGT